MIDSENNPIIFTWTQIIDPEDGPRKGNVELWLRDVEKVMRSSLIVCITTTSSLPHFMLYDDVVASPYTNYDDVVASPYTNYDDVVSFPHTNYDDVVASPQTNYD